MTLEVEPPHQSKNMQMCQTRNILHNRRTNQQSESTTQGEGIFTHS